MKAVLFSIAFSVLSLSASAYPGDSRGDHGRWGGGHGRWGRSCVVNYKKCQIPISISGFSFCPKWNSKSEMIDIRDARWVCQRLERQYGELKQCDVSCR